MNKLLVFILSLTFNIALAGYTSIDVNDGEILQMTINGKSFCSTNCDLIVSLSYNKKDGPKLLYQTTYLSQNEIVPTFKVQETGIYNLEIFIIKSSYTDDKWLRVPRVWSQDIFVVAKKDRRFSKAEINLLAKTYSPLASFHDEERFRPTSLDYIFNKIDPSFALDFTPVSIKFKKGLPTKKFLFKDIEKVLSTHSEKEAIFSTKTLSKDPLSLAAQMKERTGLNFEMVYYSFIPNPSKNEYYLNYHFLYTFDPKTGTEKKANIAEHVLDRESMTIVFNEKLEPQSVIMGAHLEGQQINFLGSDNNVLRSWNSGRVKIPWKNVLKVKKHPFAFMALGSHAIYPQKGTYTITLKDSLEKITLLREEAGGNNMLVPFGYYKNSESKDVKITHYQLVDLDMEGITSKKWNRGLAFCGSVVDLLGSSDANFPPFTDREQNEENWINGAFDLGQFDDIYSDEDIILKNKLI